MFLKLYFLLLLNLAPTGGNCEALDARITITRTAATSSVQIEPSGGQKPYRIIFFKASGALLSEDFSKQEHRGLSSGKYQCVIVDGKNCRKSFDVNIP